ncbi:MAG TPA: hypothetical protein VF940_32350 [Streptosporangiaceae bacterium]
MSRTNRTQVPMCRANRTVLPAIAATLTVPTVLTAAPAQLAGATSLRPTVSFALRAKSAAPQYANWPTFHGNQNLTGVSQDPAISELNAPQLGVRWMTHTFGPVLSSPVTKWVTP